MINLYIVLALVSVMLSSIAQVLLKKSAMQNRNTVISQYANGYVILAYGITFFCMILTIIALKGMPYKLAPIIEATSYCYILVLSRVFFKEKITKNKLCGNILIIVGIMIFAV